MLIQLYVFLWRHQVTVISWMLLNDPYVVCAHWHISHIYSSMLIKDTQHTWNIIYSFSQGVLISWKPRLCFMEFRLTQSPYIAIKPADALIPVPSDAVPDSKVHGAHMGTTGPRWAPRWPHEPCYQGLLSVLSSQRQPWYSDCNALSKSVFLQLYFELANYRCTSTK